MTLFTEMATMQDDSVAAAADDSFHKAEPTGAKSMIRKRRNVDAVAEQLSHAQNSAHAFRLKISGTVLAIGTILFVFSQAVLILHGRGVELIGSYGPPVGGTCNLLGQAVMLLALQPSDKIFSSAQQPRSLC